MRTPLLALSFAALALGLSGCATSSKFACPNPRGVTCMSATDVYGATNRADEVKGIDPDEARELSREGRAAGKVASVDAPATTDGIAEPVEFAAPSPAEVVDGRRVVGTRLEGDTLVITGISEPGLADRSSTVTPAAPAAPRSQVTARAERGDGAAYREPARIMRIFVRPFEDENGDLHLGSFVYAEITPRRWAVADRVHDNADAFQLLSPPPAAAAPEVTTKPDSRRDPAVTTTPPLAKGASQ